MLSSEAMAKIMANPESIPSLAEDEPSEESIDDLNGDES